MHVQTSQPRFSDLLNQSGIRVKVHNRNSDPYFRRLPVFQVGGQAVRSSLDASGDSTRESGDGEFWHLLGVVEVVAAELICLQCDPLAVVCVEAATVEKVKDLISLSRVRRPVDNEEATDVGFDAQFLLDFANTGLSGRLALFDVSTGNVSIVLVRRLDEEDSISFVKEESAGRHAGVGHLRFMLVLAHGLDSSRPSRSGACGPDRPRGGTVGPWYRVSNR